MRIYNSYIIKNLTGATIIVGCTLAGIILLTQSLRFLELIIESGASSLSFWLLTFLALPRFFEVILPLALMISTVFLFYRMNSDSEVTIMRNAGFSPFQVAKPALLFSMILAIFLFFISAWLSPVSLSKMKEMRQIIKAQYSTLLFREGIFNTLGDDLTVFIDNRNQKGELEGLFIYDSRPQHSTPQTIFAERGVIVSTDEGQQVLVYNGSKQDVNAETGALSRLNFERYSIDLPDSGAVRERWREVEERTLLELLNPDLTDEKDIRKQNDFMVEAHRRIIGPFLALTFCAVSLCCMLLGPVNRRGQGKRITIAATLVIILQSSYLAFYNVATEHFFGVVILYGVVFLPLIVALFILSSQGAEFRQMLLKLAAKSNMGGIQDA